MLFRIYTEDKNRPEVERIVTEQFDGFTLIGAAGYWQGEREQSLIVEIVAPINDAPKVFTVASAIKRANKQQAVLVVAVQDVINSVV